MTRAKLRSLEARYDAVSQNPQDDVQIQELTLQSLRRLINQMKEEIAPFEARRALTHRPAILSRHEALKARGGKPPGLGCRKRN